VKGLTIMADSIFNGARMEDWPNGAVFWNVASAAVPAVRQVISSGRRRAVYGPVRSCRRGCGDFAGEI